MGVDEKIGVITVKATSCKQTGMYLHLSCAVLTADVIQS